MTRTSYCYWIRGIEFAKLARISIDSIKKLDRFLIDRRFVVVTDDPVVVLPEWQEVLGSQVEIWRVPSFRPAMVANLDAQIEVLANTPHGERVLFLDADTIMLQAFPWNTADLHVTWRDQVNGEREMARQQPYNYGVLGANVTPVTIEAFYWLRARILRMTPERQRWYGNQLALADLLGQPNGSHDRRIRWTLEDEGTALSVCELPCEQWNYSPSSAGEDVTGKGILHMKGDRKDLMAHFAKAAA